MVSFTSIESYEENGFIIIPGALSTDDISDAREMLHEKTSSLSIDKCWFNLTDILNDVDLLQFVTKCQFSNKITSCLNSIIDEPVYCINDFQLQCNLFHCSQRRALHFDATSEQFQDYLYAPDYKFGKIGVFLQDNTFEFGGAIDVMPRTHKIYNGLYSHWIRRKINSKLIRLSRKSNLMMLPVRAGDAVFFDSRLIHKSSTPNSIPLDIEQADAYKRVSQDVITPEKSKYVLYWEAGTKKYAEVFIRHSCVRAMKEEIVPPKHLNKIIPFFTDYLRYNFPNDYPKEYKNVVKFGKTVCIHSLDQKQSDLFKYLYTNLG